MPYQLSIKGTDTVIGEIDDAQFASLQARLEEESTEDRDYWIDEATLDYLSEQGQDELVMLIGPYITPGQGIEVEWTPLDAPSPDASA